MRHLPQELRSALGFHLFQTPARRRQQQPKSTFEVCEPRLLLSSVTDNNAAYIPGNGTNALQFAPDGHLAQILWLTGSTQTLVYRARDNAGNWSQETIATNAGDGLSASTFLQQQFYEDPEQTQLLFTSDGTAHVLMLTQASGTPQIEHFARPVNGSWMLQETISPFGPSSNQSLTVDHFTAALGPNNKLHVALTFDNFNFNTANRTFGLMYGSNAGSGWSFQNVTSLSDDQPPLFPGFVTPRFFSLAIDSNGFANIAYTPAFQTTQVNGFTGSFSQLGYLTNRSGKWASTIVYQASDGNGDAGEGASIAVGPGNSISIASFFIKRVATGSAQNAQLLYHQLQSNGSFTTQVVADSSDNYAGADGSQFTGFAPQLEFDHSGKAQILFSDYASQHFPEGAHEFAGQIRLATQSGGNWNLQTIYHQASPLTDQLIFPAMAISPFEMDIEGVSRHTQMSPGDFTVSATYNLQMFTIPLAPNPAPAISIENHGLMTFAEGGAPLVIAPGAIVSSGAATFPGDKVTVSIIANRSAHDVLSIRNDGTGPGQIGVSGNKITYGGQIIASYGGGSGIAPLTITLNASATVPAIQSLVRVVEFRTSGPGISTSQRTITFQGSTPQFSSPPAIVPVGVYSLQNSTSQERLYRLYNPNAGFHHFTTDFGEFKILVSMGYRDESTNQAGLAFMTSYVAGSMPVHRMYNPNNGQHYFTYRDQERDFLVAAGWNYERDEGFVYPTAKNSAVEIFLLYNNIGGEHLYTADASEKNAIVAQFPSWEQQTSFGYAYTVSADTPLPSAVSSPAISAGEFATQPVSRPAFGDGVTGTAATTGMPVINGVLPSTTVVLVESPTAATAGPAGTTGTQTWSGAAPDDPDHEASGAALSDLLISVLD